MKYWFVLIFPLLTLSCSSVSAPASQNEYIDSECRGKWIIHIQKDKVTRECFSENQ